MTVKKVEFFVNGALCVVIRRDIWQEGEAADYTIENPFNWQGYVGITKEVSDRWSPHLAYSDNIERRQFLKVPGGITFDQENLGLHLGSKDHNFPRWIGWDSNHSRHWTVNCGEAITHTIALALTLTK